MSENKGGKKEKVTKKRLFSKRKELSIFEEEQVQNPLRTIGKNFLRDKLAICGLIVFIAIFGICVIVPVFNPIDLTHQDPTQQNVAPGFGYMKVPASLDGNTKTIDAGGNFSIGINNEGSIYMWGNLSKSLRNVPAGMGRIVEVSAGLDHVLVLNDEGKVFTWGNNRFALENIPIDVDFSNIVDIVAGYQVSIAIDDRGRMYVWGNENILNIVIGEAQGNIGKVVVNTTTALALLNDGTVACLTNKDTPFNDVPDEIQGRAVDLATTDKAAAAVTEDGVVHVWGNGDYDIKVVPAHVQGHAVKIVGGRSHLTVLLDNGAIESWGLDNYNQASAPSVNNIVSIEADYYSNYAIDADGNVYAWGLKGYLMGTDQFGRDVFTRLLMGGRVTLTVGFLSVIVAAFIGIIVGGIAGFKGGRIDLVLMRISEVIQALPFIPIAIILSYLVGNSLGEIGRIIMIMMINGVLTWPALARLTRGQILSIRENEYITAARAMGVREAKIIFKHILPNIIAVLLVNLTIRVANAMLLESSLSFLGFGIIEPTPTWGNMLNSCKDSKIIADYWWRWVFPSIFLSFAILSINVIGDGLRDAIDPKTNER